MGTEKTRILIVEDEAVIAADMTNLLTRKGYEITDVVTSGEDALKAIELLRPDLVFMDIVLDGEKDGIETARHINTHYDIPIIYLTAHADAHTIRRATLTTPHGYLLKPFNEDAMSITIEMALAKHGLERRIAESEFRYRSLFEKMVNAYALHELVFDDNGRAVDYTVLEMNMMLSGMLEKAGTGKRGYMSALFPDGDVPWLDIFSKTAMEGAGYRAEQFSPVLGRWYSVMAFSPRAGEFSLMFIDITEIKEADAKLKKTNEELRNLTAYLETVREEERASIAREIHDYLGQALTALRIDISWFVRKFGGENPEFTQKAQGMIELVDGTIQSVRTLCAELRPGILDDLGLSAALEWQANETAGRTGLAIRLSMPDGEIALKNDLAVNYFRIFQELVTNIVRHARASEVDVTLRMDGGDLLMEVKDNGSGISEEKINSSLSFGIMGMKERARFCKGRAPDTGRAGTGDRGGLEDSPPGRSGRRTRHRLTRHSVYIGLISASCFNCAVIFIRGMSPQR